jgi:hypothetical protein
MMDCHCPAAHARTCWAVRHPEAYLTLNYNPRCRCACHVDRLYRRLAVADGLIAKLREFERLTDKAVSEGYWLADCRDVLVMVRRMLRTWDGS